MSFLFVLLIVSTAQASKVESEPMQTTQWINTACESTHSCGLKEFNLYTRKWKALVGDYSYGTTAYFELKTDTIEQLEDYRVVQFIRGCKYSSWLRDGKIMTSFDMNRYYYDWIYLFVFKDWVIDSDDLDPSYNSPLDEEVQKMPNPTQLGYYRWTKDPSKFEDATETRHGSKKAPTPRLYVSDRPGTVFVSQKGEAMNSSLEFKVCIFRAQDVPRSGISPVKVDFAKPIACHEWKDSWVYNHEAGKYESLETVDPVCSSMPNDPLGYTQEDGLWKANEMTVIQ